MATRLDRSRTSRHRALPTLEGLEGRALLTTYQVGPGLPISKLSALPALLPGDVVQVQPGIYNDAVRITASGTPTNPITIEGVGDTRPIIDGTGVNTEGYLPGGRALIQIEGSNIVVQHLELRGAHNTTDSGDGVRFLRSTNAVLRDCVIHDNDMGIQSTGDTNTLIDGCDVYHNGYKNDADHLAHNLYLQAYSVTVQYSHIHDAWEGQNVKSRSHYTALLYNLIDGSNEGEVCLVDSDGYTTTANSNALMVGNVIVSKPDRTGNQVKFIDFGQDTGNAHKGKLTLANNTLVAGSPYINFLMLSASKTQVVATNNIFAGSDKIVGNNLGTVSGSNNWARTTAKLPAGFKTTIQSLDPGFVDAVDGDYHLGLNSPAQNVGLANVKGVDGGGKSVSAVPLFEYAGVGVRKPRRVDLRIDLGAYEGLLGV